MPGSRFFRMKAIVLFFIILPLMIEGREPLCMLRTCKLKCDYVKKPITYKCCGTTYGQYAYEDCKETFCRKINDRCFKACFNADEEDPNWTAPLFWSTQPPRLSGAESKRRNKNVAKQASKNAVDKAVGRVGYELVWWKNTANRKTWVKEISKA